MGYFLSIVAQALDYNGNDFVQTNEVYNFTEQVFVSWNPTTEHPAENDGWYWLAGDTLRVAKEEGKTFKGRTYSVNPIQQRPGQRRIYRWEWSRDAMKTIIHLALPPNFIADLPSLFGNMPSYAKVNRDRLCLGWLPSGNDPQDYTFDLTECDPSEVRARSIAFIYHLESARKQEPLESRMAHELELKRIYTFKLRELEKQLAVYGEASAPIHIKFEYEETKAALQKNQTLLREWR